VLQSRSGPVTVEFTLDFSQLPRFVLLTTYGTGSARGFDEMMKALISAPEWESGAPQLVDHRKLDLSGLSSDDMRDIRDIIRKHQEGLGDGRCAFVMGSLLGYGLARMYELLGGGEIHSDLGVFYTVDEAVEWLAAPPAEKE